MKIEAIDCSLIKLPFRFAFKHSLASRSYSENAIVRVRARTADGGSVIGYGESVPRDYVTGETPDGVTRAIRETYAPRFQGRQFDTFDELSAELKQNWTELNLESKMTGASWCALELALLDAFGKCVNQSLVSLLSSAPGGTSAIPTRVRYGGVVPFGGRKALGIVLWFYKAYGFETVKIKVGKDFDADVARLQVARRILGPNVTLRIDANCAWDRQTTERFFDVTSGLQIASVEQPVPADQLDDMAYLTRNLSARVMADESLCSVKQARELAADKICSAFNIRISKVGGLIAARQIAGIARSAGIACHMGAQVGESGILSAAGRCFGALEQPLENCEGSNNFFLLKQDITRENLNVGPGGWGEVYSAPGLGVTVLEDRVTALALHPETSVAPPREALERA